MEELTFLTTFFKIILASKHIHVNTCKVIHILFQYFLRTCLKIITIVGRERIFDGDCETVFDKKDIIIVPIMYK